MQKLLHFISESEKYQDIKVENQTVSTSQLDLPIEKMEKSIKESESNSSSVSSRSPLNFAGQVYQPTIV